jgi:hypothetical protein
VLQPQFLDIKTIEQVAEIEENNGRLHEMDMESNINLHQVSVDQVEVELKRKIESTNAKIQQLMKNQADQMQRLQT